MSFDEATAKALFSALSSTAMQTKLFQSVDTHEPWNAPGTGLYCSIILGPLKPDGSKSGLNKTTGAITFAVRVWAHAVQKPADKTDPQVLSAVATLMTAFSADLDFGDFGLEGTVRNIDLMQMSAAPAWVDFGGSMFRVMDINLVVVVNDMFAQSAGGDG
jgi:hypothetical protein